MKLNAISYMIKYLPSLLVNFQAAIYKILLLARCRAFFEHVEPTTIYSFRNISIALQKACSSPVNLLNSNNHTAVKSFRKIVSFYSYEISKYLLANILNI